MKSSELIARLERIGYTWEDVMKIITSYREGEVITISEWNLAMEDLMKRLISRRPPSS